ncbi:MAG: hypothetical protein KA974_09880 [Saprospiraceae bacterium]|nr:hypothetical protein [Saprospiraceae bacterium]MBP7679888.1 hypothetical protein [Saprospiraceae bacterium]
MKNLQFMAFVAFAALTISSCSPSLSPFTEKLYQQNKWDDDELKRIQFYLSNDVVLQRKRTEGSSKIISGEIKVINGEEIEQVTIKHGTPGVFLFRKGDDKFAIGFESSNTRYLVFGPNPKRRGYYVLMASDWDNRQGKIEYDSKTFYTMSESVSAILLVDLKKATRTSVKSRTAKGRKIDR